MIFDSIAEKILDQVLKINKFQDYVNRNCNHICGLYLTKSIQNANVKSVFHEYKFNDIRENDIVLDIGANVGGFSMFVSKMVKKVYAVEPMVIDLLEKNIQINNIDNIIILEKCLGYGKTEVLWANKKRLMEGTPLKELIELCGGHVDFLKCDCEGTEWNIKPEELKGIRRIEIELHNQYNLHDYDTFLEMLYNSGFEYKTNLAPDGFRLLVHAKNRSK